MPIANDKQTGFSEAPCHTREILSRSPSFSLVGLLEKKGEKGNNKSRVFVFEYKFKFEFV
jgi:hypothetical protein